MINKKSSILITGGTGSFGHSFVAMTLKKFKPRRLIIFSRDEMKQWEMSKKYKREIENGQVLFFIGDVRDKERLYRALYNVDYVVHAAASKIVSTAEYNPFECIKTNINGATNLIEACIDQNVKKVVALSTDKASSPVNLYGATKLASDKLFIASNSSYAQGRKTKFSVVRYGNVMGSRGSVIPLFLSKKNDNFLPITDERMTRFMMTIEEGINLVWHAFENMIGGEIYIKKNPSIKVTDIAKVIAPKVKHKIIGIQKGEKLHEQMISFEDSFSTYEYSEYYKILPNLIKKNQYNKQIKNGKKVPEGFVYSSDNNSEWLKKSDLKKWIFKK